MVEGTSVNDDSLSYGITSTVYADVEIDEEFDAPAGHRGATPVGLAFVDSVVRALLEHQWEIPFRWVTPEGHAFEVRGGGKRFDVSLSCVEPEEGAWDLVVEVRRGLMPWKRKPAGALLDTLGVQLEEVMRADPRVRGIELDD
jgi:hypothetical protein